MTWEGFIEFSKVMGQMMHGGYVVPEHMLADNYVIPVVAGLIYFGSIFWFVTSQWSPQTWD